MGDILQNTNTFDASSNHTREKSKPIISYKKQP